MPKHDASPSFSSSDSSFLQCTKNNTSMISVLGSTGKYILQPSLLDMHRQTLEWLSATALWKRELSFFQNLLDKHAPTIVCCRVQEAG